MFLDGESVGSECDEGGMQDYFLYVANNSKVINAVGFGAYSDAFGSDSRASTAAPES